MQASEIIADWYESQLVAFAAAAPRTITDVVAAYGGTAAAAKAIGVAQRTVQRWTRQERGEGGETRNPSPKLRDAIEQAKDKAQDAALARQIKRDGITITRFAGEMCVSTECDKGHWRIVDRQPSAGQNHIDGDDLGDFLDAAARAAWDEAAQEWEDAFFGNEGYHGAYRVATAHLGDITRLDMDIG